MSTSETIPCLPPANGKREFAKTYGSTLLGQSLILGLGILTGILSARMLGPVGRGEYAAVIIWPMGIATLISLGINQAIAFSVGRRAFTISEVTTAAAIIGLVQSALSIVIGLLIVPCVLYPGFDLERVSREPLSGTARFAALQSHPRGCAVYIFCWTSWHVLRA
jgi:O-antigen/teichoic acid export membrane protein